MSDQITIPPEALEAAKIAYNLCEQDDLCIEAACRAMLQAWPKMAHYRGGWEPVIHNNRKPHLILPLQESANDKG